LTHVEMGHSPPSHEQACYAAVAMRNLERINKDKDSRLNEIRTGQLVLVTCPYGVVVWRCREVPYLCPATKRMTLSLFGN
jgi:hypothetical protein